jgi:hypothetical protein
VALSWNRSQRGIQIFFTDGTWGLPSGAIEPSTARVISAERLKVICYKCVKGGRNRPALIRDLNGNACTELLKNCLQNTDPSEINGLKIRLIERSVRVRVPPSAYSMWGSNAAIWRRIRSQGSPRSSRTMSLRKSSRLMNSRSCYLSHEMSAHCLLLCEHTRRARVVAPAERLSVRPPTS